MKTKNYEAMVDSIESYDPIASELMSTQLSSILSMSSIVTDEPINNEIKAIKSKNNPSIGPEDISRLWGIGLRTAKCTLAATTHECIRTTGLLSKRFKTNKAHLRYNQLSRQYGVFYCNYLKAGILSLRGFIGGVVYTNKLGFKKFFPCKSEAGEQTGRTAKSFIELVGLPYSIHSNNHRNFKDGFFKRMMRKFGIYQTFTEPNSPWQNRAEPAIGEIKSYARRRMQTTNTPVRLWCFCYEYSADLLSLLSTGRFDLKGRTLYKAVMHYTPDISEYVSFSWYQWCKYYNENTKQKHLCRWLGPAHTIGQSFCSYILIENGQYIAQSLVVGIEESLLEGQQLKEQMQLFTESVEVKIGNSRQPMYNQDDPDAIYYSIMNEDRDANENVLPYGEELVDVKTKEVDQAYLESLDKYIGSEVVMTGRDGVPVLTKVVKRKRDANGDPIGEANPNPIMDSRIYELEYPDGRIEEFGVNVIGENLGTQLDEDRWDSGLLEEIVEFRCNDQIAIPMEEGFTILPNGERRPVVTTKGWDVKARWKDRSTNWLPLAEIKESCPIEVAEAAVAHRVHNHPAFNWWVGTVLQRKRRSIKQLKSTRQRKDKRMKFGITVPKDVKEAEALDIQKNNRF